MLVHGLRLRSHSLNKDVMLLDYMLTVLKSLSALVGACQCYVCIRRLRVYPYPRVYPTRPVRAVHAGTGRVGSSTGTTSTGTGVPGFTRKEHDFSVIWSENLFYFCMFSKLLMMKQLQYGT